MKKDKVPSFTLAKSMWHATLFHLGTVAFGSLILAIIRMIRTILEYVESKCKQFNNDLTRSELTFPLYYFLEYVESKCKQFNNDLTRSELTFPLYYFLEYGGESKCKQFNNDLTRSELTFPLYCFLQCCGAGAEEPEEIFAAPKR
jgi:hypothetical protein